MTHSNRWTFLEFILAALVLAISETPSRSAEPARRNILLLIADDFGLDCGCYGNTSIKTPNIDALAAEGVCFTNAFACVSSCSPSRSVLFTGLHTHQSWQYGLAHGPHHQYSNVNTKSLPLLLNAAGYRTGIVGKFHVEPKAVYPFEVEDSKKLDPRDVVEMARRSREFIVDSKNKPFFLVVGFIDPHRDFGINKTYKGVPEYKYDPKDVQLPYFLSDQPDIRQDLAEYYHSASRMDHGVGLVRKALQETGHADDTLVIFLSDNGIPFPGAKTNLYDSGVHLPLIVSSPAQKNRGHKNDALVRWVDVTPTILDYAGLKPPAQVTGKSLLPILDEEHPKDREVVFASHQFHEITMYYPMRMIRTREFKYILNLAHPLDYPLARDLHDGPTWQGIVKRGDKMLGQRSLDSYLHRPREELFDLKNDPNELKNVAGDPAHANTLDDLRVRLKEWQTKTKDPWLSKYQFE